MQKKIQFYIEKSKVIYKSVKNIIIYFFYLYVFSSLRITGDRVFLVNNKIMLYV